MGYNIKSYFLWEKTNSSAKKNLLSNGLEQDYTFFAIFTKT